MSWKVYLAAGAILLAAAPVAAEDSRPAGTSPFKKYTCDQKHSLCVERCQRAYRDGDQLKRCMEECAGKWLKCKGVAARTDTDTITSPRDPGRK